ncbi:MAG: 3-phosphoglycerate dehydrogenase family protein, partial [Candidatus Scatosoma sp.]
VSPLVEKVLGADYDVKKEAETPVGVIVRSFEMKDYPLPQSVLAVARAGAGVNNIPTEEYAKKGVVVFNTPGANANAVCELVLAAMLLGSRRIVPAIEWANSLKGCENLGKEVEKGKKRFVGGELLGKKLGVLGLGAIGAKVANAALALHMDVLGYDPFLSVNAALNLSHRVKVTSDIDELFKTCDYITLHVPMTEKNRGMVGEKQIAMMKDGAVLINCARGELVNNAAVIEAAKSGKIGRYITDFPAEELLGEENVICIPHLGASTPEAEDNCAVMAANELKDYIENGNIVNSVNYPACYAPRNSAVRLVLLHLNQQNMIAQFTAVLAENGVNIDNFVNSSKGAYACSIIDIPAVTPDALAALEKIDGVISLRKI